MALPTISRHLHAQDKPAANAPAAAAAAANANANAQAPRPKADPDTVIASAGPVEVTAGEFEQFVSVFPPEQQAQLANDAAEKRRIADHLVKMKAMMSEAERRKVAEDPKVKAQLEQIKKQMDAQHAEARRRVILQAMFAGMQADEAGDKKYFEDHKADFEQVTARHILVSTKGDLSDADAKKKADDIRARIVKGEEFAAIAKAESDDPGSKDTGGEYTFGRGSGFVKEFTDTAYALKENEISQPVKTEHGYHIIQLLKRIPSGTYEQAKQMVPAQRVEAMMKELTGGEQVKFNDAYLTAAAANAPAAAAGTAPAAAAPAKAPARPAARPAK
jgi:parvulin-like peptidyl-prolyl isomerase